MSRACWSVWQIGRGGAPELVGTYASGADARRVLRSAIPRGAAVDPDGEVNEARGVSPAHVTAIEAAADEWLAAVVEPPPTMPDSTGIPRPPFTSPAFREAVKTARVAAPLHDEIERLEVALADATARAVAAEQSTAQMQAVLDGVRATAAALDTRAERAESERDALASSLRERSEQLDAARVELATRDRTIATLRAELAAKPRRTAPRAETPLGTIMRRIAERARGVR